MHSVLPLRGAWPLPLRHLQGSRGYGIVADWQRMEPWLTPVRQLGLEKAWMRAA